MCFVQEGAEIPNDDWEYYIHKDNNDAAFKSLSYVPTCSTMHAPKNLWDSKFMQVSWLKIWMFVLFCTCVGQLPLKPLHLPSAVLGEFLIGWFVGRPHQPGNLHSDVNCDEGCYIYEGNESILLELCIQNRVYQVLKCPYQESNHFCIGNFGRDMFLNCVYFPNGCFQ